MGSTSVALGWVALAWPGLLIVFLPLVTIPSGVVAFGIGVESVNRGERFGELGIVTGLSGFIFTVFILGPCEPLVPLVLAPAATGSWWLAGLLALVFAASTLTAMVAAVAVGRSGLGRLNVQPLERFGHALAGLVLAACGAVMLAGL